MLKVSEQWLGTETSLAYLLEAMDQYRAHPELYPPRWKMMEDDEDYEAEAGESRLIQIEGSIGLLNVSGPLTSQESWLDSYFGVTSYPAIARGMIELTDRYQAGDIDQIIHVFDTPGGDANGINGLTEVMRGCLEIAPNTVSYTGSRALSAGYWLPITNPKLYTDKMAETGSIGVVSTITSMARRLEESGIDVRVVRSGAHKALLHPAEPISEEGIKEVKAKSAQFHSFFLEHVRAQRPGITGQVSAWGEGQTFFGEDAIRMGLADGPAMSLNSLVNQIKTRHNSVRKQTFDFAATSPATRDPDMKPKVLFATAADQAAVAAGASLAAIPHTEVPEGTSDPAPTGTDPADTTTTAQAAGEPGTGQPPAAGEEIPGQLSATPDVGLATFLQSEVATLRAEQTQMALKLAQAEQALATATAAEEALKPIACEAIQRLQIALRQAPISLAGLPATVLAAQYTAVRAEFERVMPVGVRAQSGHDESREPQDLGEQRLFLVK